MDADMWYDADRNPYVLFTLEINNGDTQKALDYIQYPEKYGIISPERLRILDVTRDPEWEDPKIEIIVSMSSDLKVMIPVIKKIEKAVNGE